MQYQIFSKTGLEENDIIESVRKIYGDTAPRKPPFMNGLIIF